MSRRRPTALARLALPALLLAACTPVAQQTRSEAPADRDRDLGPPPYAAFARERVRDLEVELSSELTGALEQARDVREALDERLAELVVPERFATDDRVLRTWHEQEWKAYQASVRELFAEAIDALSTLQDEATRRAVARAEELVGRRSPLDQGATGDVLVDNAITSFVESLRAEVRLGELENRAQRDAIGFVELVQVFSTFGVPGADDALGGRLILYVGGAEGTPEPRAKLVLKSLDGERPQGVRVLQAIRHRVHRGYTIVDDLGWRKMPRGPQLAFHETALVADGVAPRLDTTAEAFEDLHDMRIVSDIQSVLVRGDEVLGGVDWRIVFRVTLRGDVSWQLSERPRFNPICAEARGAFGEPGS